MRTLLLMVLMAFCCASYCSAGDAELPVLKTRPKAVALFKNGLGFFVRDGEASLKDGWAMMDYVPSATLGTLWIGTLGEGVQLEEVTGFIEETAFSGDALSLDEILRVNVGRKVRILDRKDVVEGVIKSVPGYRKLDDGAIEASSVIIIGTPSGDIALERSSIGLVQFPEGCATTITRQKKVKRLKFKVSGAAERATLGISYLSKGITWTPGYRVNIDDPAKAKITMQATVVNDVEDLEDVDMYFVVGYPNFLYADMPSPLTLEENINQFIGNIMRDRRTSGTRSGRLSNVAYQTTTADEPEEAAPHGYDYSTSEGLPGAAGEDLFLYHKKNLSLKKGARAYYHIFSGEVEYRHIYEWNIPDTLNVSSSGYSSSESDSRRADQIWHSLKLHNSTDAPWTTAPALVVSGWKPVAQDEITYTPKGARTNLKLTIATDVKTDRREYEAERVRDVKINTHIYDLVTVKGELSIRNMKGQDITMEIRKRLTGDVVSAGAGGKVTKVAEGLRGANLNSVITWELPVKAGQKVEIAYTYKVYITH